MNRLVDDTLLNQAGALLLDAAGMLQLEADEWRSRKNQAPKEWTPKSWADRCTRIADTNIRAATKMRETAKKIALVVVEPA